MRPLRDSLMVLALVGVLVGLTVPLRPPATQAQTPASLMDEAMLSAVLPPLADGSRPGVHLWARADQSRGPAGLPTVFVVTLYTKQSAGGPEEREVVNYLQYSNGAWTPARPRDDGTLLIDDWAWISLNLTNLTASATGQGDSSQYTVDYTAGGNYGGAPRQLVVEEVYAADLSLASSVIVSDTNAPLPATPITPTPTTSPRPAATAAAVPTAAATRAATPSVIVPPSSAPAGNPPSVVNPAATPTGSGTRSGTPTP